MSLALSEKTLARRKWFRQLVLMSTLTVNIQHLESLNDFRSADHGRDSAEQNAFPTGRWRKRMRCRLMLPQRDKRTATEKARTHAPKTKNLANFFPTSQPRVAEFGIAGGGRSTLEEDATQFAPQRQFCNIHERVLCAYPPIPTQSSVVAPRSRIAGYTPHLAVFVADPDRFSIRKPTH